jgi:hypothetical protein
MKKLFVSLFSVSLFVIASFTSSCNRNTQEVQPTSPQQEKMLLENSSQQNLIEHPLFLAYMDKIDNLSNPFENIANSLTSEQLEEHFVQLQNAMNVYQNNPTNSNYTIVASLLGFTSANACRQAKTEAVNALINLQNDYEGFIGLSENDRILAIDETSEVYETQSMRGYMRCARKAHRAFTRAVAHGADPYGPAWDTLTDAIDDCADKHL